MSGGRRRKSIREDSERPRGSGKLNNEPGLLGRDGYPGADGRQGPQNFVKGSSGPAGARMRTLQLMTFHLP
ncbi:hypothetical protein GCK72_022481 [Caenorhabditis remanei]|uniref:Uncharacterized protein n=1 Tax=Caenorhabditis remanei TaxID=31234 RepID=A0A6A5FTU8_CAERE|nr:hypothetical protein GCK72_022481 [Caenorhabditis remanei]KAF1746030.1 hypothetical protein GCK72_022481 [Caenorhabditis remanei]